MLTLEAAVDSLDSDFRPLDVMKDIFKSTPNLNNKDGVNVSGGCKKSPSGIAPLAPSHLMSSGHARSTSYSVSYCTRKNNNSPIDKQGEFWVHFYLNSMDGVNFIVMFDYIVSRHSF